MRGEERKGLKGVTKLRGHELPLLVEVEGEGMGGLRGGGYQKLRGEGDRS